MRAYLNTKNCFFFLILGVFYGADAAPLLAQSPEAYEKKYYQQYQEALRFLKSQKTSWQALSQEYPAISLPQVIAAIFPELVRFSELQNKMESYSLELLYVRFGSAYANFSIGRMQMKPSFAETLEALLDKLGGQESLKLRQKLAYADKDAQAIRKERVKRLNDWEWQLHYALAFAQICAQKFNLSQMKPAEQVKWLAAIYNRGVQYSREDIGKWMKKRTFPYGPAYRGEQFIYSEIAVDFYERYALNIFEGF